MADPRSRTHFRDSERTTAFRDADEPERFFVSYQLNAYPDQANRRAMIYSELHQNIQDSFNEGEIEILSPHYFQLRDGNTTTIPAEYARQGLRTAAVS